MPFSRDTLTALRLRVLSDLQTRLPGSDPFRRRSPLGVIGTVLAGLQDGQFGYLDWEARQAVPFTARDEYLVGWAGLRGVLQEPAVKSSGTVSFTGGVPTTVIAVDLILARADGRQYIITAGDTFDGSGNATVSASAVVAGVDGDCDPGATLNFAVPLSGAPSGGTVGTMGGGADVEADDHLLTRSNEAWANPPQGGDLADYARWVRDNVPAVTRVWAGGPTILGAGTVVIYPMLDDDDHPLGIPIGTNGVSQFETRDSAAVGDQLIVADAVYPLRPVTALVYCSAPISVPLNITLAEVPADATIRANIALALEGLCLREASPGGVQITRRLANGTLALVAGGTIPLSHLDAAIAAVPDLDYFVRTAPTADITVTTGRISTPGTITYS